MYTQTNQQSAVNEFTQEESQNVLRLSFMSCSFGSVDVKYILKEMKVKSRLLSDRGTREAPDGTLTERDKSPLLFSIHTCSVGAPDVFKRTKAHVRTSSQAPSICAQIVQSQSRTIHLSFTPWMITIARTITIKFTLVRTKPVTIPNIVGITFRTNFSS